MDHALVHEQSLRQKVATVELTAIDADEVDFSGRVGRTHIAARGQAGPGELDRNRAAIAGQSAPFALNPLKGGADLEYEVGSTVFRHRLEDRNARLCGGEGDRGLGGI